MIDYPLQNNLADFLNKNISTIVVFIIKTKFLLQKNEKNTRILNQAEVSAAKNNRKRIESF
jgi:hypothetical protein